MYYKVTIVTTRLSDLQQCRHCLLNVLVFTIASVVNDPVILFLTSILYSDIKAIKFIGEEDFLNHIYLDKDSWGTSIASDQLSARAFS